jgi:Rrf2 family protein
VRLSTRGHYGLKAMFDLAQHYGSEPIPLKTVAERQNISDNYLEQLIAILRKAGLVKSVRGAQGGYILARDPGSITVGDIIRAMEGPIALRLNVSARLNRRNATRPVPVLPGPFGPGCGTDWPR